MSSLPLLGGPRLVMIVGVIGKVTRVVLSEACQTRIDRPVWTLVGDQGTQKGQR